MLALCRNSKRNVTPEQKIFAQSVGQRLRALRLAAGNMERPELAQKAGVKVSLIRDAEQGVSRLTLDNAAKIAHALGVPVDSLLDKSGPREPTPEAGRPSKAKSDDDSSAK